MPVAVDISWLFGRIFIQEKGIGAMIAQHALNRVRSSVGHAVIHYDGNKIAALGASAEGSFPKDPLRLIKPGLES